MEYEINKVSSSKNYLFFDAVCLTFPQKLNYGLCIKIITYTDCRESQTRKSCLMSKSHRKRMGIRCLPAICASQDLPHHCQSLLFSMGNITHDLLDPFTGSNRRSQFSEIKPINKTKPNSMAHSVLEIHNFLSSVTARHSFCIKA